MTDSSPGPEKRVHLRRSLRVPARIILGESSEFEVRTYDISEGGLGLVAAANPKVGTKFNVVFGVPNSTPRPSVVNVRATVIRSVLAMDEGGFKIGVLFNSLDEPSFSAIRRFINRV
ncbi:MAG: PilZ domain-containing protein [Ideonella sp. WA131b]|nr:PilZ domain-containing protein [Ideonella sp. WA131b]